MRYADELVLRAAAHEPQLVHELELVFAQQMQHEASGLEDHVVAQVELVKVDREARDRWHDRGAHGAVQDHAVALPGALARDRHDRRREVAEQLIDRVWSHVLII